MYAIVDIAGQQFKVEKDKKHYVHRLSEAEGNTVDFDKVLLIENDGKINVGAPVIQGARVSAKILHHLKGDKVYAFKKNRRKGFKVIRGHRQYLSQILIESIEEKAAPRAAKAKTEVAPKVAVAVAVKKTTTKKAAAAGSSSKTEKKPAAVKKPTKKKEE